ncbi:hypothetical protein GUJ93_ZPchr0016g2634 [Zizania palustris]|uniref:Uncharacterized protein n=1 Tax=Zizania palustris TaxID=103762 RepID=A0A8J5VVQ3_ZIZPA|nr:hypothetical protein GUJ93_ZPchr0016g2634 [Zizania palustris]
MGVRWRINLRAQDTAWDRGGRAELGQRASPCCATAGCVAGSAAVLPCRVSCQYSRITLPDHAAVTVAHHCPINHPITITNSSSSCIHHRLQPQKARTHSGGAQIPDLKCYVSITFCPDCVGTCLLEILEHFFRFGVFT